MKIINNTWTDSKEKRQILNKELINIMDNIHKFYIGFKEIKNFSLSKTNDNQFIVNYGLQRNSTRKYYVRLLNSSFAFNNDCLIALRDVNQLSDLTRWKDNLNGKTLQLLGV